MDPFVDLIIALARAGWRPISVVNVVVTCAAVLFVLRMPLDPDPTLRNFGPLVALLVFLLVCMTVIVVTADEREP